MSRACEGNENKSFNTKLDQIIDKIAKEHGLKTFQYHIASKLGKGENYLGEIKRLTVEENGTEKLKMVMKSSVVTRGETPMFRYYECENFVYKEFLPELLKIQNETKTIEDNLIRFAKCFHSSLDPDKQIIIMEDLNTSGYVMADRLKSLDRDHIRLVIKKQALYHALAFAYKHSLSKKDYEEKVKVCVVKEELNEEYTEWCRTVAKKYVELIQDKTLNSKMVEFTKTNIKQSMYDSWDVDKPHEDSKYNVLIHCDLWTNNFLFKYDKNNKVVDMVMVDWQTLKPASPVCDLIFTLYMCLDETTRLQLWDELLDFYYDTLSSRLNDLGLDPEECYPEAVYKKHLKDKMYYGLIISVFGFHVIYGDKHSESEAEETKKEEVDKEFPIVINETCIKEMNGVLRHLIKMNVI